MPLQNYDKTGKGIIPVSISLLWTDRFRFTEKSTSRVFGFFVIGQNRTDPMEENENEYSLSY